MSKKHSSLDFFPQESTVQALPTFEQSPLVTLQTSDHLVCELE